MPTKFVVLYRKACAVYLCMYLSIYVDIDIDISLFVVVVVVPLQIKFDPHQEKEN